MELKELEWHVGAGREADAQHLLSRGTMGASALCLQCVERGCFLYAGNGTRSKKWVTHPDLLQHVDLWEGL